MTKVYTSQNHTITGFYTFSTYIQALTKGIKLSTDAYPTIGIYPSVDTPPHLLFYDGYEGLLSLTDLYSGGGLSDHQHTGSGDGGNILGSSFTGGIDYIYMKDYGTYSGTIYFWYWGQIYGTPSNLRIYGSLVGSYRVLRLYDDVTVMHDFNVLGSKSAVVNIDNKQVKLYSIESPEVWFEDFGSSQLVNGEKTINIDSQFLQTVTINETYPAKIFLQVTSECNNLYTEKHDTYFIVRESNSGTSNATFDYRLIAKRKDYENKRLEEVQITEE